MSTASSRKRDDQSRAAVDSKDVPLQVMVPARIKREVSLRAAHEGATQRTIVLRALMAVGFVVGDDELYDKRKIR